ncbi:MAG: AmmeMemoRadiSam system protein B [Planctomycetota bacterium]
MRPLEAHQLDVEDGRVIVLRDPAGFQDEPIAVRPEGYLVLTLMDGARTLDEIQKEFERLTKQVIPLDDLRQMTRSLDERHLLDSAAFDAYRRGIEAAFVAAPVRPAVHADAVYPSNPDALTQVIDDYFVKHVPAALQLEKIRALVAPHIDFARGWKGFAAAYRCLATLPPPDTVVVVGTAHYAEEGRFILCEKSFATPYGNLELDRELASAMRARYPGLARGMLAHRNEHSLEFQAVFLKHRYGERAPRVVPILCTTLDDLIARGEQPRDVAEVSDFVAALRDAALESGKSILFISGADLSHVGRQFGDARDARGELAEMVERADRGVLDALCRASADDFFGAVAALKNQYRICSVASLYTVLSVARAARPAAPLRAGHRCQRRVARLVRGGRARRLTAVRSCSAAASSATIRARPRPRGLLASGHSRNLTACAPALAEVASSCCCPSSSRNASTAAWSRRPALVPMATCSPSPCPRPCRSRSCRASSSCCAIRGRDSRSWAGRSACSTTSVIAKDVSPASSSCSRWSARAPPCWPSSRAMPHSG